MCNYNCKYCNSDNNIIKKGIKYNKQCYYCKECKRYFTEGKDKRIKRDIKQKELAILLYMHNSSMRSIQSIINKIYNTRIAFNLITKWIKSFCKLSSIDINNNNNKTKTKTIEVLELDELYSKYYDFKKNEWKESKYGLLLIEEEIKLLHLK